MTVFSKAIEAIEFSEWYDTVAMCLDARQNHLQLACLCDEWVDTGEVVEYWKNDPNSEKMLWRVHINKGDKDVLASYEQQV